MRAVCFTLRLVTALVFVETGLGHGEQAKIVTRTGSYPIKVHQMYRDRFQQKPPKTIGVWSSWSTWTSCSRSCGGGVTQQTRHCINRPSDPRFVRRQRRRRQANGCVGLYKRIRLCNSESCPSGRDFRWEQCEAFNNRLFKGKTYVWQPFLLANEECALNCRPSGMNFYATLNKTVIDGTTCTRPRTSLGKTAPKGTRGVCIDGQCKSVNANGIIGTIDVDNANLGGNQEECAACQKGTCRSINGLYTRPDLPPGYSLVAQIPQGACRILIQQLKHTRNFLALKNSNGSFILNGDWKITNHRITEGAGTRFTYLKQEGTTNFETITSPGPLANPVDILIVNYQTNHGIKYGYSLPVVDHLSAQASQGARPLIAPPLLKPHHLLSGDPITNNLEPRRLEIPNNAAGAIPLNHNNIQHQRDEPLKPPLGAPTPPLHLAPSGHPQRRTRLRRRFVWKLSGVSACSKSCGGGIQATVVTCVREHTQTPVLDRRCAHMERPMTQPIRCNVNDCPPKWDGHWTPCTVSCGTGLQHFVWQCQQELSTGRTVIINEVACPRPKPPSTQSRPCAKEPCESTKDNELSQTAPDGSALALQGSPSNGRYEWSIGPWSACSVSCGTGHRTRPITCPSGQCPAEIRPKHAEYCEKGPCTTPTTNDPKSGGDRDDPSTSTTATPSPWLVTEWSHCSEVCGTGTQIRLAVVPQHCPRQNNYNNNGLNSGENCTAAGETGSDDNDDGHLKIDRMKPETSRACSSDKECGGQWFTGPWSACFDSCTAPARQKREVLCVVKIRGQSHITNDMTCSSSTKPHAEQACRGDCPSAMWFVGEWGACLECPRQNSHPDNILASGLQRREVRCLDAQGRSAAGCNETNVPIGKRQCDCQHHQQHHHGYVNVSVRNKDDNVGHRRAVIERYQPAQDEPFDRSCSDRIRNCHLAVQARLCQYPYYINQCCASCKRSHQDSSE